MTSPLGIQLRNTSQPPRPSGPKHDGLHMAEGLRSCWCMCGKCFMRYGEGHGGVCICRECPCAGSYEATKPMYVPYTRIEGHPR